MINVKSRPTSGMGRPPPSGKRARHAPDGLTGVKMAARHVWQNISAQQGKSALATTVGKPDGQRRTREGQRRPEQTADGSV
jgi:hypothetical protein